MALIGATVVTASEYLTVAKQLTAGTPVDGCRFSVEWPKPGTVVVVCAHDRPAAALVAATALKEFWPRELMPINTLIEFRVVV